jgi:hypothetical protein
MEAAGMYISSERTPSERESSSSNIAFLISRVLWFVNDEEGFHDPGMRLKARSTGSVVKLFGRRFNGNSLQACSGSVSFGYRCKLAIFDFIFPRCPCSLA